MSAIFNRWNGPSGKEITETLVHDGVQRTFILYIPWKYTGSGPVPLLLNFHGYKSNAEVQMWYGDFRGIADNHNFIVVHPEGTLREGEDKQHWNAMAWTNPESTADDLGFVDCLLDHLSRKYKIDSKRIYATGFSNGGDLCYLLAYKLGHRIAAIASVSGLIAPLVFGNVQPTRPVPVLHIHGADDDLTPYVGDHEGVAVMLGLEFWATHNGCDPKPNVTQLVAPHTAPNSKVEYYVYSGPIADVAHFKVFGCRHTWPGTTFEINGDSYGIDASQEIWRFFGRYDLDGARS